MDTDKETLIVFTYAPAGLGHIRVTDALIEAIPPHLKYTVFTAQDSTTETMHRFSSINTWARKLMEFTQKGKAGYWFTKIYTKYLKTHTDDLLNQFIHLVQDRSVKPQKIIIVSTHFGLAYQLGELKNQISKILNAEVFLVVQVTDDSPQDIWYVDSADLIFCPSLKTKNALKAFARKDGLPDVPVEVVPYPVSLEFSQKLSASKINQRLQQYDPTENTPINIIIPVSGAAVGMEFFAHLIHTLHKMSPRFVFHIVCRQAPFTLIFLHKMSHRSYVRLYVSSGYRETVNLYKTVYKKNIISAEITKPSEQAFKALLDVDSVGGAFLLLAEPVGRQEHDNLNFLKRNGLIETASKNTRGWILPQGSKASAELTWSLYQGTMLETFKNFKQKDSSHEIGSDGAKQFWKVLLEKA
ncbi:MAG: hypothetical protein ABII16_02150 [Patescibacteria group bacterium]|nr:hypothetical protein [Patescibacteria group bacterium]